MLSRSLSRHRARPRIRRHAERVRARRTQRAWLRRGQQCGPGLDWRPRLHPGPLRPGGLRPRHLLWLVYALFFVAGAAQSAIVPLLPRLSSMYGFSPSETALLLALPGIATLVVSMPAGLAADRFGARRVTLAAGILMCLACLAQATPSLAVLLAGRIGFGIAFGVVWTTGMSWLAELDPAATSARLGPSVTCSSVGVMIGPAIGGMLAQHTSVAVPFLLIATLAAIVVVPLALGSGVTDPAAEQRRRADQTATAAKPSWRELARTLRAPEVTAAAASLAVAGAVVGVSQLLIPIGLHRYGLSAGKIGFAFSAAALSYIAVSVFVIRLGARASTLRVNAVATLMLALALVPALAGQGALALVAALLLTALPRAVISTIAYSLAAAPGREGRGSDGLTFGLVNGGWAGAMVLSPVVAGALEQGAGSQAGFLAVVVPCCLVGLLLVVQSRPRRVDAPGPATGEFALVPAPG